MARSRKTGLDYFPLDCQMNDKIDMLEAEHGLLGFAVYIKLLQLIYQTDAGELDMSNVFRWKTLGKKWEASEDTLRKLVDTMCEVDLFDKNTFREHQLLTSEGVQKRLGKVAGLREKDRLRHGKADTNQPKPFSSGKPTENAIKEKERKRKVNTADAVVREHATTNSASLGEQPAPPAREMPADEAPVFRQKEFSAFVTRMGYGTIDKGRYLLDIQRKANDQKPRTTEGWENYILEWLKRDLAAGRLLAAEPAAPTGGLPRPAASTTYDLGERATKQQGLSY